MQEVVVQVQADHLRRQARVRKPSVAIAELIWNGLDADATWVQVVITHSAAGAIERIIVRDNGHGIKLSDAQHAFECLGDSLKLNKRFSDGRRRMLHGKRGRGRFRAFALGEEVAWQTTFEDTEGRYCTYTIHGTLADLTRFEIGDPATNGARRTGTEVVISRVRGGFPSFFNGQAVQDLTSLFALHLEAYQDIEIVFDDQRIDPSAIKACTKEYALAPVKLENGSEENAKLRITEWKTPQRRSLHLCDEDGFTINETHPGIQAPGFEFTAYLKSACFADMDESGVAALEELDPDYRAIVEAGRDRLRQHFRERAAEAAHDVVAEWKRQRVYPYSGNPRGPVERAERQVFDVVALSVNSYLPEFEGAGHKSKRFSFRLLRQALERNPADLQEIMGEVLDLSSEKRQELAELLKRTNLTAIINASNVVADRLDFVHALNLMIFDTENREDLKERGGLHEIVGAEAWVFGEQYAIAASEVGLTKVLRKHRELLGDEIAIDEPVRCDDGSYRRIDLMFSRMIPGADPEEREHLVVELKRPNTAITADAQTQIERYARAVANNERFRDTNTRWHFWAVSTKISDEVRARATQANRPRGLLFQEDGSRVNVWVKSWGEIIDSCRARLEFFRKQLEYRASDESAVRYLLDMHEKYLPSAIAGEDSKAGDASDEENDA
jgi:hypothetical protein